MKFTRDFFKRIFFQNLTRKSKYIYKYFLITIFRFNKYSRAYISSIIPSVLPQLTASRIRTYNL